MTSLKIYALKYKHKKSVRIHGKPEKKNRFFLISAGNVLPQKNPFVIKKIEKIMDVQLSREKNQSFVI